MNERDAAPHGVAHRMEFRWVGVQKNLTGIGALDAGEDFHEGAFARAVLADDSQDLAGVENEVHSLEGAHGEETFGDVFYFEEGLHWDPLKGGKEQAEAWTPNGDRFNPGPVRRQDGLQVGNL